MEERENIRERLRKHSLSYVVTNRVLSSLARSNVSENGRKCFGFPACEKG